MLVVHIDTETNSKLDPVKVSFNTMAKNCTVDIVTWGTAPDFYTMPQEVHAWDARANPNMPVELATLLLDSTNWFVAFNSGFDEEVIRSAFGIHYPNNWLDSGVAAARLGYSVSTLDALAKVLNCEHQKVELLPGLMKLFSRGKLYGNAKSFRGRALYNSDGTVDLEYYAELRSAYIEYAIEDTWTSAEVFVKTMQYAEPYPIADFLLHQKINRNGIGVDTVFVDKMIALNAELKEHTKEELRTLCRVACPACFADAETFCDVCQNAGEVRPEYEVASHQGFAKWLAEMIPGWNKGSAGDVILPLAAERITEFGEDDLIAKACKLKASALGTANAKFTKLKAVANPDGRLYDNARFDGAARTGRPSGSGVQMLNLARPFTPKGCDKKYAMKKSSDAYKAADMPITEWVARYGHDAADVAAKIIRAAFVPAPGHLYVDYDFSSIENVILMETTQDPEGIRIRREKLDAYIAFGVRMTGKTYEEIVADKEAGGTIRQDSKPPVLGCGYGMSGPTLQDYARGMGQYISLQFAAKSVDIWRESHSVVVDSWEHINSLFKMAAISEPGTTIPLALKIPNNPAVLERHSDAVVMRLPCGRGIWYMNPKLKQVNVPYRDKQTGERRIFETQSFTYRNNKGAKSWQEGTHGGKLTGNFCQATGNSLLRDWMRNIDEAGVPIVLHVYDQVLAEVPTHQAEYAQQVIQACVPGVKDPNHWSAAWGVEVDGGILDRFWK